MSAVKPFPFAGERRMATVQITPELLAAMLHLPDSATVLGTLDSPAGGPALVVLESEEFPVCQEGAMLPIAVITYTADEQGEVVHSEIDVIPL